MKPRHLLLIGSLAAIAVSIVNTGMAFANDRYATLPPVYMSPDLSAPWVAQLHGQPARIMAAPHSQQPAPRVAARQKQKVKSNYRQVSYQRPAANPANTVRKSQIDPIYLPQMVSYSSNENRGQSSLIQANASFISFNPAAKRCDTALASESRVSVGRVRSASAARPNGQHGHLQRR